MQNLCIMLSSFRGVLIFFWLADTVQADDYEPVGVSDILRLCFRLFDNLSFLSLSLYLGHNPSITPTGSLGYSPDVLLPDKPVTPIFLSLS